MSRKLLAAALAAAVVAYGSIAWGVDYTYNAENVDSNTQWYDGSDSGPLLSDSDIAPSPGIITNGTTDSIYIATPGGGDWTERYTDTGLPDGTYLDLTSRGDTGILRAYPNRQF